MSKDSKLSTDVITIRIDRELNMHLDQMKQRLGLSKADLIRNYLDLSRYLIKQKGSIKSLNDRDFIIVKRGFLRKICNNLEEEEQIHLGDKLGKFINDIDFLNNLRIKLGRNKKERH